MMENKPVKLDIQGDYVLWQLVIDGETVYNVTRINEPPPDSGYYKVDQLEEWKGVNFGEFI